MKQYRYLLIVLTLLLAQDTSDAQLIQRRHLHSLQRRLAGQIVDHTANHHANRRFWSEALGECRDMYVYLPPGYDPAQRYPLLIWLHGMYQDEAGFLYLALPDIDAAMACGRLPACIIAMPDGTLKGRAGLLSTHSAYLNSKSGNFEDYLMVDIWNFLMTNYPIRPERQAHVMAGVSLGGGSAYHMAIKHRDRVGIVLGIHPPLNVRWVDCNGRYFGNFDPSCWGWRTETPAGHEPLGRFGLGLVKVPARRFIYPLYGRGTGTINQISRDNPIEMMEAYNLRPNELAMLVVYGGRDQFNMDAQIESFLFRAKERGLCVHVCYDPRGRHDYATARPFMGELFDWLRPQLAPYSPVCRAVEQNGLLAP